MDAHDILRQAKARLAEIDKQAGALTEERALLQRMVDGAEGRLTPPVELRPLAPPAPTLIPMPYPMPYHPPPRQENPWGTLVVTGSSLGWGAVG